MFGLINYLFLFFKELIKNVGIVNVNIFWKNFFKNYLEIFKGYVFIFLELIKKCY